MCSFSESQEELLLNEPEENNAGPIAAYLELIRMHTKHAEPMLKFFEKHATSKTTLEFMPQGNQMNPNNISYLNF
jgi:hypothetical protein